MELIDILKQRKSIRKYTGARISQEHIDTIVQAGDLAPTSRNLKPCQTFVVRDAESLKKLSESKDKGATFVAQADTAIIVAADSQKSDTWIEDSSIRLTFMMLAAESLHIGSCWIQMHLRKTADGLDSEQYIRNLLQLPEQMRIVGFLSLGIKA